MSWSLASSPPQPTTSAAATRPSRIAPSARVRLVRTISTFSSDIAVLVKLGGSGLALRMHSDEARAGQLRELPELAPFDDACKRATLESLLTFVTSLGSGAQHKARRQRDSTRNLAIDVLLRHRPSSIAPCLRQQRHGFHLSTAKPEGLALPVIKVAA